MDRRALRARLVSQLWPPPARLYKNVLHSVAALAVAVIALALVWHDASSAEVVRAAQGLAAVMLLVIWGAIALDLLSRELFLRRIVTFLGAGAEEADEGLWMSQCKGRRVRFLCDDRRAYSIPPHFHLEFVDRQTGTVTPHRTLICYDGQCGTAQSTARELQAWFFPVANGCGHAVPRKHLILSTTWFAPQLTFAHRYRPRLYCCVELSCGFFVHRFSMTRWPRRCVWIGDTWHASIDEASRQVEIELCGLKPRWRPIPPEPVSVALVDLMG